MMKGLLIFLSVSVRLSVFVSMSSDSETAGAVNTMSGASVHTLSTGHNAAHSFTERRAKQTDSILYSIVFAL